MDIGDEKRVSNARDEMTGSEGGRASDCPFERYVKVVQLTDYSRDAARHYTALPR